MFIKDLLELIFPLMTLNWQRGERSGGLSLGLLKLYPVQGLSVYKFEKTESLRVSIQHADTAWKGDRLLNSGLGGQHLWKKTDVTGHISVQLIYPSSAIGM